MYTEARFGIIGPDHDSVAQQNVHRRRAHRHPPTFSASQTIQNLPTFHICAQLTRAPPPSVPSLRSRLMHRPQPLISPSTSTPPSIHFCVTLRCSPIPLCKFVQSTLIALSLRRRMQVLYHVYTPEAAGMILTVTKIGAAGTVAASAMPTVNNREQSARLCANLCWLLGHGDWLRS